MTIRIPAEWEAHECCWMSWAVHREWKDDASEVERELRKVIETVAQFERVRLLAPYGQAAQNAEREFAGCGNVTVIPAPVDDIWMRDIAPTFALLGEGADQEVVAIDWNFTGWGCPKERPCRPGDRLAGTAASILGVPKISAGLVAEGGALVTDGAGTMITTRSCLLNPNRNPSQPGLEGQQRIEAKLHKLGINQLIWLEGDPFEPITSGHADGYVLCAPNGTVLVESVHDEDNEPPQWREHDIALLEDAHNTAGRKFEVRRVLAPRRRYWRGDPETFAACYLNAYVANGAVIGASFGDAERDEDARTALEAAFPDRKIKMLKIDHIANGGGGVHCLTQPMPALSI